MEERRGRDMGRVEWREVEGWLGGGRVIVLENPGVCFHTHTPRTTKELKERSDQAATNGMQ